MPRVSYNKYGNKKTIVDGIVFDSKKEANRFSELKLLLRAGKIKELRMQVAYELVPEQREPSTIGSRGGIHKGALIEKPVKYIADFVYWDNERNKEVVEDTKGKRTKEYIIKRKLMLYKYGIRIKEV